ncbi:MAG: PilZ domain-containing protein [Anaeromyxobacter sp.]|nr:PilZ domain-containing protein [Anaeromyxobacter sp.]MBL0278547.1 PilZ domain-containing protein [Anaeromyxobacter sp.]
MTDYIVNPRRAPRAQSRCRVHVRIQAPAQVWDAETEDIGPHGCQLVAPAPQPRGTILLLEVQGPAAREPLRAAGRVAWVNSQPPWRLGVAFEQAARPTAARWFSALLADNPGLGNYRRVPDRLPVDAMVFLALPPRFADFGPDELELLRHVAGGATIAALRARLEGSWAVKQRTLFALLSRGLLTVSRGAAAHPETWKHVMAEYGTYFLAEAPASRESPVPTWVPQAPPLRAPPGVPGSAAPPLPPPAPASAPPAPPPSPAAPPAAAQPPPQAAPGASLEASAGTGWRGAARRRSMEAQEAFDLGRQEAAAGRGSSALALLRRALQLAPGDTDVAAELARVMKG